MTDAPDPAQNQPAGYVPPKVWQADQPSGGAFANINRPFRARRTKDLPSSTSAQLYEMGRPLG